MAQKLIIDTDPGQDIDDLLAIWFALRRPELDVKAITTVTWPADQRARLIKRLLRYLGRTDIPVAAGMAYPLRPFSKEEIARQENLASSMNHACFAEPLDPRDDPGSTDAVDLLIRTVEENAGEIALACIAPLTNIATALCRRPEIARKIQYIALMGGEVSGNRAEHNIAFDYVASDIVLRSGIPIAMGTWSVTRRFAFSMAECAEAFDNHASELAQAMGKAIKAWHPAQNWKPGPVMYDLFPIIWAFDRSYYKTEPMHVQVETKGEHTRGFTILRGHDGPKIEVTTDIREAALKELYLKTILAQ